MPTVLRLTRSHKAFAGLLLIAALSLAGQASFSLIIQPQASLAGANGLSAALGLANGHGMRPAESEGLAIKFRISPLDDIRQLYDPNHDRIPLIEPLPGLVLIYFLILKLGVPFTLQSVAGVNMLVIALCAVLLAQELMRRRWAFGFLSGLALALFVPLYRMSIVVGYDTYEFAFALASAVALLKFERTSRIHYLVLNALLLGAGLWIRSYFILFVLAQGIVVVIILVRRRRAQLIPAWVVPVVVLAAGMVGIRDSGATGTALTRGAIWHSFWMGVGQFENDEIEGFTDWHVCWLARDLGHPVSCDPSYEDDRTPYLFQYGREYNAVLRARATQWVGQNFSRFVANAAVRVCWLAVPGLMDASRLSERPLLRAGVILVSLLILFLALVGWVYWSRSNLAAASIVLGTYLALLPLTVYYIIAKVVTIVYFCILVLAVAGVLVLWDRYRATLVAPEPRSLEGLSSGD